MKQLYDPEAARTALNSRQPTDLEDEAYLEIALDNWIVEPNSENGLLDRLAQSLVTNHDDFWLRNFLDSASYPRANQLLVTAMQANHAGDADGALKASTEAAKAYVRFHNVAGILRSQFEKVYALRRLSRTAECIKRASQLARAAAQYHYHWIDIQVTIEQASCEGMRANPDLAWDLATSAGHKAVTVHYSVLHLRALGHLGNLDMLEGRSDASWINNGSALDLFWQDTYPDDRGFQLYYNLQVDSERSQAVYLALALQRETLNMIAGRSRFDFEAMAHFRLAGAAQSAGDQDTARREIQLYRDLISKLPTSYAKDLYQAYCEIGLARLALQFGSREASQQHLDNATAVSSKTENSMLRLEYLKTAADIDNVSENVESEHSHLEAIVAIAGDGFSSLKSAVDRWRWRRVVEGAYRRLLEIELSGSHSPARALGFWEFYHRLESEPSPVVAESVQLASLERLTQSYVSKLHKNTLVSFAVLSGAIVAWVADDRGIREFTLAVKPIALRRESRRFYFLCSDPHSSIEKVNASGLRLYQWLIAPLEEALDANRVIAIEPDGFLTSIPWAALRQPDGTYLGNARTVVIHPGLFSGLGELSPKGKVTNVVVAVPGTLTLNGQTYPRLSHADEEAAELSRLYPGAKELRGSSATVPNILNALANADIFEFAGHAVTREHGGELIVHATDGAAVLSASSVSNLQLKRTRLVVLSACSTAAEYDADRDPGGLVRAFWNAGAGQVIATRWDVDSRFTTELMKQFHRSFKDGVSAGHSLNAARQVLSAQEQFAHPFYWAGLEIFSKN